MKIILSFAILFSMQLLAQPWIYDFGTVTGSFTNPSSTSGFLPDPPTGGGADQVRVGNTGGGFELVNSGSDSELQIAAASGQGPWEGTGVINKFSVYNYTPGTSFSIGFNIKFNCTDSDYGRAYFFIGDGDYFINDTRYIGEDLYTGIRWRKNPGDAFVYTEILSPSGTGYVNINKNFEINREYYVEMFGNNTGSQINYNYNGIQTLNAYSYDLWIDGTITTVDNRIRSLLTMNDDNPIDSYMILAENSLNNQLIAIVDDFKYSNQIEDGLPGIPGKITGTVSANGTGLAGVEVGLIDSDGFPVGGIGPTFTDANGVYEFFDLNPGQYQVGINIPLGYTLDPFDLNPTEINLLSSETEVVNFNLDEVSLNNIARGRLYWEMQFILHLSGWGWLAEESEAKLLNDINNVHQYYDPHFDIFEDLTTFDDWRDVLRFRLHPLKKLERAKAQVAALILNFTSLKIGQQSIVTVDEQTAGDVLTYCSVLLSNPNATNDDFVLVERLARQVNLHQIIEAGTVPDGGLLYKGFIQEIDWNFGVPEDYKLAQNYPNPFNPSTNIQFSIPKSSKVTMKVFDILGNEVGTLVDSEKQVGNYEITWNAENLPSGVYLYRIQAGDFVETKKMMLMK